VTFWLATDYETADHGAIREGTADMLVAQVGVLREHVLRVTTRRGSVQVLAAVLSQQVADAFAAAAGSRTLFVVGLPVLLSKPVSISTTTSPSGSNDGGGGSSGSVGIVAGGAAGALLLVVLVVLVVRWRRSRQQGRGMSSVKAGRSHRTTTLPPDICLHSNPVFAEYGDGEGAPQSGYLEPVAGHAKYASVTEEPLGFGTYDAADPHAAEYAAPGLPSAYGVLEHSAPAEPLYSLAQDGGGGAVLYDNVGGDDVLAHNVAPGEGRGPTYDLGGGGDAPLYDLGGRGGKSNGGRWATGRGAAPALYDVANSTV
jgi:hypothetical protein